MSRHGRSYNVPLFLVAMTKTRSFESTPLAGDDQERIHSEPQTIFRFNIDKTGDLRSHRHAFKHPVSGLLVSLAGYQWFGSADVWYILSAVHMVKGAIPGRLHLCIMSLWVDIVG